MGTVGLSFGSPTSGTGFNVSQTVASIVSNLQNVETPWQNQLTSLESQDSVISNLGTLFSNLSNDLSQLTDFQGVLAQKSGSSSDNSVLELTAASASATAGTHTVVVQNLAQTSSGYLDAVSNSSDTLSGSLTIGVNGNSQTFDMSDLSNQTLAGLASAINSSNVGVTANVLTDASGSRLSLVSNTSGAAGEMTVSSSITDPNNDSTSNPNGTLNYNDAVDGKNAQLTIDGVQLESASNTVTNLIPGVTFQLLEPSPTTDSSGDQETVQVVIANDNTQVESAVNQFVSDYNSLISAVNTQEGNTSSGTPEPLFGSPTISLLQQQLLSGINTANPNGYFDAISSNDALSGSVTITVGSGTAQTIDVPSGPDNTLAGLAAAINSAYAGSASGVTASVVSTSTGSQLELLSGTAGSSGALTVTSSLTDTTTGTAINYNGSGSDINSLTSLGISVNNDGSLTFDANSLDSTLNSDYSSVENFFQGAASWGQSFSTLLTNAGTSSPTGILALASSSNSSIESSLNAEITKENSLISAEQSSLTAELNSANETLQELPSQLDGMNELYSAITGYNQNS
jgi:flagellar hook-associated protein 2